MHPKSFVGRAPLGPAGGAYSAPPDILAGFKGPTSKEGEGGEGWEGTEGKGREGKGREALGPALLHIISGYATGWTEQTVRLASAETAPSVCCQPSCSR